MMFADAFVANNTCHTCHLKHLFLQLLFHPLHHSNKHYNHDKTKNASKYMERHLHAHDQHWISRSFLRNSSTHLTTTTELVYYNYYMKNSGTPHLRTW